MSEELLNRALDEMKAEDVDAATLEAARARVRQTLTSPGSATCAEFRPDLGAYLGAGGNVLAPARRTLVEDHLSRCPGCRAALAELKGGRRVLAMPASPKRGARRWPAPVRYPPAEPRGAKTPRPGSVPPRRGVAPGHRVLGRRLDRRDEGEEPRGGGEVPN